MRSTMPLDEFRCPILGSPHSQMGVAHQCVVQRDAVLALIEEAGQ